MFPFFKLPKASIFEDGYVDYSSMFDAYQISV